jgi:hypothetical protein
MTDVVLILLRFLAVPGSLRDASVGSYDTAVGSKVLGGEAGTRHGWAGAPDKDWPQV